MEKFFKESFFYIVGIVFLLGFFYLTTFLMTKVVPTENKEFIGGVLETMKNGAILILGYFYGSSKGSSDKNNIIKAQENTVSPPTIQ